VIGSAVGVGLVALTAAIGGDWVARLAVEHAVGPSVAVVGVVLAATSGMGALWRRRLRVGLMVVLVTLALYSGSLVDIVRLAGGRRARARARRPRRTRRERVGVLIGLLSDRDGRHRPLRLDGRRVLGRCPRRHAVGAAADQDRHR
jgi:hypothetical protein